MANTAILGDLRTASYRRADQENSLFVGRWEANGYVNNALSEVHDLLVSAFKEYLQSTSNISLVALTESYSLPGDFYKLLAAFFVSSGVRYAIDQFMLDEITDYNQADTIPVCSGGDLHYRLVGNKIYFTPKPESAGTVEMWYVPQFVKLVDPKLDDGATTNPAYTTGADVISYAVPVGWEEYAEVRAAIDMANKEENFELVNSLRSQLSDLRQRIISSAGTRNAHKPQRIRDVYGGVPRVSPYSRRRW